MITKRNFEGILILLAFLITVWLYMSPYKDLKRGVFVAQNAQIEAKMTQGLYAEAIFEANKILKMDPGFDKAYCSRCIAYINLKSYEAALRDCDTAIKIEKENYKAHYYRGIISLYRHDKKGALKYFKKAKKYALKHKNNFYARNSYRYISELKNSLNL